VLFRSLDPSLVQGWVDGTSANYGLAVTPGATSRDIVFGPGLLSVNPPSVGITWHYQGEAIARHKTLPLSAATYTDYSQPSTNFNSSPNLVAGRQSGAEKRIFIQFNPSLP